MNDRPPDGKERLTAFEFIAADEHRPTLVRIKHLDTVLYELAFVGWTALPMLPSWEFDRREDLVVEGEGIARPYWNDEPTPWSFGFDRVDEQKRIAVIRAAVQREVNRLLIARG